MEAERAQHEGDQALRIDIENALIAKRTAGQRADTFSTILKFMQDDLKICANSDQKDLVDACNWLLNAAISLRAMEQRKLTERPRG